MDARTQYRQWADRVKASGGVVTVFPSGPSRGQPAARYPAARIAELQRTKQLGAPGTWTADRSWGYYLATAPVVQAAKALPDATKQEIASASAQLKRQWFGDFGVEFGGTLKKALIVGTVGVILAQALPPLIKAAVSRGR